MEGVERADGYWRVLLVAKTENLAIFALYIGAEFNQPNFTRGNVLQHLSIKLLRGAGDENALGLLALEGGARFVNGNPGCSDCGRSAQGEVLECGGVCLLRIELHQGRCVPVAHLTSLGSKVVKDYLSRGHRLARGGRFAQPGELRQPSPAIRRRSTLRHAREPSHRASLAGDNHFFTLLNHPE